MNLRTIAGTLLVGLLATAGSSLAAGDELDPFLGLTESLLGSTGGFAGALPAALLGDAQSGTDGAACLADPDVDPFAPGPEFVARQGCAWGYARAVLGEL